MLICNSENSDKDKPKKNLRKLLTKRSFQLCCNKWNKPINIKYKWVSCSGVILLFLMNWWKIILLTPMLDVTWYIKSIIMYTSITCFFFYCNSLRVANTTMWAIIILFLFQPSEWRLGGKWWICTKYAVWNRE